MTAPEPTPDRLPPHAALMYRFHVVNAFCWSILLGFPIVLFFKHHDASATVLGMALGAAPLLTVLQIPAAVFLEQVGYRRFLVVAWAVRGAVGLGMAAVAVAAPWIGSGNAMTLMLGALIVFAAARGIGSAAMLPWFTQLIPEDVRGRYLSGETVFMLLVVLVVSLAGVLLFDAVPGDAGFAIMISVGGVAGAASVLFLRRVPDVAVPAEARNRNPVPWSAIIRHRPFVHIMRYNVVIQLAWTGGAVCVVPMLRDQFGKSDAFFMTLNVVASAASIAGLLVLGRLLDRAGSRPLLLLAAGVQILHFSGWTLVAGGLLPLNAATVVFQQVTWGGSFALYHTANMRLLMQTVPPVGRSHFFAAYSVVTMLAAGVFPVFWGLVIDLLAGVDRPLGVWHLTPFSSVYPVVALCAFGAACALLTVREERALPLHAFLNELLVRTPARALSRLAQKRPLN